MKTAVIGAGAWGTALAKVVHLNGGEVCLWGRDADALAALGQAGGRLTLEFLSNETGVVAAEAE